VSEKYYGTAYGILESISNMGKIIGPILIGATLD
jgi:hypothetical protein